MSDLIIDLSFIETEMEDIEPNDDEADGFYDSMAEQERDVPLRKQVR